MGQVLDCREAAKIFLNNIKEESGKLMQDGINPTLAIVRVGKREDDIAYERGILKNCEKVDITGEVHECDENIDMESFTKLIQELNVNPHVHGILIFRPLPKHLDENVIKHIVDPNKDVDSMNPLNLARVFEGDLTGYMPCTPAAVMEIIKHFNIDVKGKKVAVMGRSMVVGKPLAMMMLKEDATVTICHSKTENLKEVVSSADIVAAAIGKAKFINSDYIKKDAVVIDVGINVDDNGKLCGDVDFEDVKDKASLITPVPGGVGSVTTAVLLKNVIKGAKLAR
ncbi:MAG: bifunctional 5,10-methylenetetrahydrofolate dehydrogenase/5,10-methenyltetrahydrofolate cyclohydrolase [Lutispora sp.]|jgi:methylenetetrahydrofolate dehydrogenase (NADP+)/methenyltetrahydrofolate cyclohydrolase|uniref:bifunctional 5,10-methylenetetrahydrofolate dehydrogenase/5,10-methenyltetrahydrofolate cyclohydrolase n=1 Tax=Lutispora sp. TaxID=2828727 RepID=UPI0035629E4D